VEGPRLNPLRLQPVVLAISRHHNRLHDRLVVQVHNRLLVRVGFLVECQAVSRPWCLRYNRLPGQVVTQVPSLRVAQVAYQVLSRVLNQVDVHLECHRTNRLHNPPGLQVHSRQTVLLVNRLRIPRDSLPVNRRQNLRVIQA
jgi:hypothetical protein